MNPRQLERALTAADPADPARLDRLDLEAMAADLLADLEEELPAPPLAHAGARRPLPARRLVLALGSAAIAGAIVGVLALAGGGSDSASRTYDAELVRFAESSPLLLLDGPGWRVQDVTEERAREGIEGSMEFVTGSPIPFESIRVTGNIKTGIHESGMAPASVRQRKVALNWHDGSLKSWLKDAAWRPTRLRRTAGGVRPSRWVRVGRWVTMPVLGTTAHVNVRAEMFANRGGPGDREMTAIWAEGGHVLELRAAVPDRAAFEERLRWLTRVDSGTWLQAMPEKVVKAADFEATVREMVRGIPVPKTFAPSRVPDEGLTTAREQVASKVAGTIACLWFRQWGEARRSGDRAAEIEAERAMATSRHWSMLRQMEPTSGYPGLVWELAAAMPRGYWDWHGHKQNLLGHAEGLNCAREGFPLLPRKIERQREHGVPPPPG